jgi:sulfur-oxidizing protein SoxX
MMKQLNYLSGLMLLLGFALPAVAVEPYYAWQVDEFAINQPLGGLQGDPARGKKVVIDKNRGNCLTCHAMPIPEEPFHGTIGPSLAGIASRLNEGQLRLRIVDEKQINPMTIMPGYYRDPKNFNLVLDEYSGKTFLTAQEVEDVVAYLMTLK